jgi:hypothetical protein
MYKLTQDNVTPAECGYECLAEEQDIDQELWLHQVKMVIEIEIV